MLVKWITTCPVEITETQVEFSTGVGPSQREIRMPVRHRRFVDREIDVHGWIEPQTTFDAGERAFAKVGQVEETERAQVPGDPREVQHRLAELLLAIEPLNEIRLTDRVDEMPGLGDAPEHFSDAELKFPTISNFSEQRLADGWSSVVEGEIVRQFQEFDGVIDIVGVVERDGDPAAFGKDPMRLGPPIRDQFIP